MIIPSVALERLSQWEAEARVAPRIEELKRNRPFLTPEEAAVCIAAIAMCEAVRWIRDELDQAS